MIPLKWMVVLMAVGTLMTPVVSGVSSSCSWLTPSSNGCVKEVDCQSSVGIYIWEDCKAGEELFTITNNTISIGPDCAYVSGNPIVTLKKQLNAEDSKDKFCDIYVPTNLELKLFFEILNFNEFPPTPAKDTASTMEVQINENADPGAAKQVYYTDDDLGEAALLTCEQITSENGNIFSLEPVDGVDSSNIKTFNLRVKEKLDFEKQVFYKMEYNIISTDERGNQKSTKQTFFIYVNDMPDEPPFWSQIEPVYTLSECRKDETLFTVTAQDRDVDVNYAIKYSMAEDPDGGYFEIDGTTGVVRRSLPIDREELLEQGISSFRLTITATEYKPDGTEGEDPNNSQQVTIIPIQDCNNKLPTFDKSSYEITMDELTEDSKDRDLNLIITVTDKDEGNNGTFTLTTSNMKQLDITPDKGKQTLDVTLTAFWESSVDNYFDYEVHQDTPLKFNITATEEEDPNHLSTVPVTITLRDLNDNTPVFDSSSYKKNFPENTPKNTALLQVAADDEDVSEKFGKQSIRYNLAGSCYQLEIDETTGWVTLIDELDYEESDTENEIHCTVTARDEDGSGLTGTSEIIISVSDVVDEPPLFQESQILMSVEENTAKDHEVGRFIVTDADKGAVVEFTILSSVCSGSVSTVKDVDGWFSVVPDTPKYPDHPAIVKVNGDIDREACNQVTLHVMAVDVNTEEDISNDNGTVIIAITDVKDKSPIFKGDYSSLNIDEFDENDLPTSSKLVFQVTVSDPDEGDTINLSISNPDKNVLLELSVTQVTVTTGGEATVDVMTKVGTEIDRETQDIIEVEITLTNDDTKYSTPKIFKIKINDLNDKAPTMNPDFCGKSTHVAEDDGTGSVDGTLVHKIEATDADTESPYNSISYKLINDELDDSTPFKVDEETGEVSVFLSGDRRVLDREKVPEWELQFRASDQCRQPTDTNCKVLSSSPPCTVTVTVDDVNDKDPRDLTWTPPDNAIEVTDFLAEDDDLGYILWALDDDIGKNAFLSYTVVNTFNIVNSSEEKDLFYAVDETITSTPSCRLFAKQNFMGMNLTGRYNVTLEARDGGGRATNFTFTIIVKDGNDHAPYFKFDKCPDAGPNTIVMAEKSYTPGENGNPRSMEVKCSGPDGVPFNIHVIDADTEQENRDVIVEIDAVNSTIVDAENEMVQLSYWSLEPKDCNGGCHLKLSHKIAREEGTPYNLALHVRNTAEHLQESWAMLQVVVTNVKEYDPYFCSEGDCSQIVYIFENNPDASREFMEATDRDNINLQPGDDEYDNVYYFIKGGDTEFFIKPSDGENKIILNNLPDGLDREKKQNYSLYILATNNAMGGSLPVNDFSKNNILHLIINVGDVNDEEPTFVEDVIFSSFMQSNKNEDRLTTIEALDADLNETLTYTIKDDLQWIGTDIPFDGKFTLEQKDERSVYLKLGFDPTALTQGYSNFTLVVEDKGAKHRDETQVKVYIITDEYQVAAFFSSSPEAVKEKKIEVQHAFSKAYSGDHEYMCVIDSITATQTDTGDALANETTIYMHFIDNEKNEPMDKKMILDLTDNANVMTELRDRLDSININLISVGTYRPPTSGQDVGETVLTLKILLGVVSLVLSALLVLVISIYCIRTRSLTRKVKVLSTNTFGSKASGLNHMGLDMVPVPGSNLAKVHGNHNPVFSENEAFEYKNQDTGSISSGDSVLVGVEDNPEFKNYAAKAGTHTSSQGFDNPTYGRSIDEVSAPPPGVQGGMKGNPLLNLGGLQDDPEPSTNTLGHHAFGNSDGSEGDTASLDHKMNSNFTFL